MEADAVDKACDFSGRFVGICKLILLIFLVAFFRRHYSKPTNHPEPRSGGVSGK